ncbi:NAD(P)H-dependent glycerol-3-phosphate dehydrogenase [Alcaligenes sp. SDU_A2]|uniref:NAD(P)H-dependent glycerol-3-phosphate dehydrogenase n=1 Tax=Alcaligenes sp. SDU_A2 TaxID=3136634 RepID=UPI00311F89D9
MPHARTTPRVAVLGAGSWGTALAALACAQAPTMVWARNSATAQEISSLRRNEHYLPDIALPDALQATDDLAQAMAFALADDSAPALIILGVPVRGLAQTCQDLSRHLPAQRRHPVLLVWTCKGFQHETGLLPHQIARQNLPSHAWLGCAVLSGPSFALEVAKGLPVALTLACEPPGMAHVALDVLHGTQARLYTSGDTIGVEVGGALKNIMAIACGIADALGLGHNARAALITRGLAEMQRLGVALGGQADTFAGLAGLGDLVLTATGELSRNRQVGLAVGAGQSLDSILATGITAEGVRCASAALAMGQAHHVDLPITEAVCQILFHHLPPRQAVHALLTREAKQEGR